MTAIHSDPSVPHPEGAPQQQQQQHPATTDPPDTAQPTPPPPPAPQGGRRAPLPPPAPAPLPQYGPDNLLPDPPKAPPYETAATATASASAKGSPPSEGLPSDGYCSSPPGEAECGSVEDSSLRDADFDAFAYLTGLLSSGVFGVDIGGTAGKVAFLQDYAASSHPVRRQSAFGLTGRRAEALELDCPELGGRIHFLKWATSRVGPFCDRLREERMRVDASPPPSPSPEGRGVSPGRRPSQAPAPLSDVYATGGGAFKFEEALSSILGLVYHKVGEFDSLALGLQFLLNNHPETVYTVLPGGVEEPVEVDPETCFPCAVCNIGSGVSVLKIQKDGSYERLGGTSIGGSTFLGLCRLTTGASSFEESLNLARQGRASGVDTTVSDIYGDTAAAVLNLPGDAPASSFGKLVAGDPAPAAKEDIAASLLSMVTQAIQQIAVGLAKKGNCKTLFFTGGFLRGNELSQRNLASFARLVGEKALFLHHAEYAGALGCLTKAVMRRRMREGRVF